MTILKSICLWMLKYTRILTAIIFSIFYNNTWKEAKSVDVFYLIYFLNLISSNFLRLIFKCERCTSVVLWNVNSKSHSYWIICKRNLILSEQWKKRVTQTFFYSNSSLFVVFYLISFLNLNSSSFLRFRKNITGVWTQLNDNRRIYTTYF